MTLDQQWWVNDHPPRKGDPWSSDEARFLLKSIYAGYSFRQVSVALMRSPNALKLRACELDDKIRAICANFDPQKDYDVAIISPSLELLNTQDKLRYKYKELEAANIRISELERGEPLERNCVEVNANAETPSCEYEKYGAWILISIVYIVTVFALTK